MGEQQRLIWIDLEMTGLDPLGDRIIEIATLVTDKDLNEIAVGPVLAVRQDEARLAAMDEWNQTHHGASGLIDRVRSSRYDEADVERLTLEFLSAHLAAGESPMCGNSICQDRRFLARYMPQLERFFHYRNLDVSTIKELARRWRPDLLDGFRKQASHIALEDVRESIAELAYYRTHFFRASGVS
ncbi:MAG: oligoribonuclease [Pseudomonadota bacterium]|nr:oligoribonuclease [Pseudomonadota bacterium]